MEKATEVKQIPRSLLSALLAECDNKADEEIAKAIPESQAQEGQRDNVISDGYVAMGAATQADAQESEYVLTGNAQSFSEFYAWVGRRDLASVSESFYGYIDKKELSMPWF